MLKITKTIINEISNMTARHDEADLLLAQGAVLFVKVELIADQYEIEAFIVTRHEITVKLVIVNGKVVDLNLEARTPYWGNKEPYYLAVLKLLRELKPQTFPFEYITNHYHLYLEKQRQKEEEDKIRSEAVTISRSKEFVAQYKNNLIGEISHQHSPIEHQIIAFLEKDNGTLNLRFKIGDRKKYLIKDIQKFLLDVAQEHVMSYGKNIVFKHSKSNFDEISIKIIDLIRQMMSTYERRQHTTKVIELERTLFDQFFEFYHHVPTEFKEFWTKDDQTKFSLTFKDVGSNYLITFNTDKDCYFGKKYVYTYENQTLSRIPCDSSGKAIELLKHISQLGDMLIEKKDLSDFYTFILSDIKDYFKLEGLDHNYIEKTEKKITLYGDIDDHDQITLELEYLYEGGHKEKGFNPKNQNLSLKARKVEAYIKSQAEIDIKNSVARMSSNEDEAIQFIQLGLPYLKQLCDVQVTDILKRTGEKATYSLSIRVSIQNDLLSIDLDSIDISKSEIAGVLDAYKQKRKFYKLANGAHIHLEADVFAEISDMLEAYQITPSEIEEGQVKLNMFQAFSINDYAKNDSEFLKFNRDERFKETIEKFSNIKNANYPVPDAYKGVLRDYQKRGFEWLKTITEYGFGGILADDMGLGKTLQVITVLSNTRDKSRPNLVICPASLILNWEDEIHKFAPHLTSMAVYGGFSNRESLLKNYHKYDIVITSYDYIRRDIDHYDTLSFNYIVLDEAQYIKNPKSKGALAVKRLKGKYRLALTGTPIENSLAEMWSIFDFLMPGYLYNYRYFQRQFEMPIVKDGDEEKQHQLKNLISPFILRRTKKEVLTELPDKIEQIIKVEFNEEEYRLYLANLAQVNEALQAKLKLKKKGSEHIEILAMLMRLRQICCEPRMIYENMMHPSSKLVNCIDLIKTLRDHKRKILVFSSFTKILDLISEALDEEKISYYTLTGSTSKHMRRMLVNQFQADDTSVFLISLKAGGTGLNLTAAEAVIHFDPWWNSSAQNQATDRAHRMGQENPVQVFKLIMKNSIEEKILKLQETKKYLSDTFIEGNDGKLTHMSTEELIELFRS